MSTAATASDNVREAAKDTRTTVRDVHKAASEASGDIQSDLQALRDDFGRLAEQVSTIITSKGNATLLKAKSSIGGAVFDAQQKGREAVGAVSDVSDNFVEAIDDSIKKRPYATLALVAGLGFICGATWRR